MHISITSWKRSGINLRSIFPLPLHNVATQRYPVHSELRSLEPLFTKLAKSHIPAQFFVCLYQCGTHILRPHKFYFPFVSEKRGSKLWKFMNDFHELLFKIVCIFFAYWRTADKILLFNSQRCNNWTTKYDVTKYLNLNTKNCNI